MDEIEKDNIDLQTNYSPEATPLRNSAGSIEIASYHAGPLPDPLTLARFEQVLPGAAKRLFDDFEEEARHRRLAQRKMVSAEVFRQTVGSISSAIIGLVGVSGGVWLAHEGKSLAGLTAFLATLTSLAGIYIAQQKQQARDEKEERDQKNSQ